MQQYHPTVNIDSTCQIVDGVSFPGVSAGELDGANGSGGSGGSGGSEAPPQPRRDSCVSSHLMSSNDDSCSRLECLGHSPGEFVKVRHDNHYDFLVAGSLHHWHNDHCDNHGKFDLTSGKASTSMLVSGNTEDRQGAASEPINDIISDSGPFTFLE